MEEEKKTPEREEEQALPVQELPTDIPAEVRQDRKSTRLNSSHSSQSRMPSSA